MKKLTVGLALLVIILSSCRENENTIIREVRADRQTLTEISIDGEMKRVTVEWFGLVNEGPKTYSFDGTYIESIRQPEILLGGFYKWDNGEWFSTGSVTGKPGYLFSLLRYLEDGRISYPIDAITFLKMTGDAGIELKDLARFSTSPDRLLALTPDSNPVIITFTLKDHIRVN